MHNTRRTPGPFRVGPPRSNLATVKLLGRKKGHEEGADAPATPDDTASSGGRFAGVPSRGSRDDRPQGPAHAQAHRCGPARREKGPGRTGTHDRLRGAGPAQVAGRPQAQPRGAQGRKDCQPGPDDRSPGTHDGRRRGIPAAARPGPDAPLRPRCGGLPPQRARPVHAVGAGSAVHHVSASRSCSSTCLRRCWC